MKENESVEERNNRHYRHQEMLRDHAEWKITSYQRHRSRWYLRKVIPIQLV